MGRRGAAAVTSDSDYDDHSNTQNATIIGVHVLIHPHHTTTPTHPPVLYFFSLNPTSIQLEPTNQSITIKKDPSSANHSWAVALGLVPCLAGWALQVVVMHGDMVMHSDMYSFKNYFTFYDSQTFTTPDDDDDFFSSNC